MTYFRNESLVEKTQTSTSTSIGLGQTSSTIWDLNPSAAATVTLPGATNLSVGQKYRFFNRSTQYTVTVQKFGGSILNVLPPATMGEFIVTDNSTSAGSWIQDTVKENALVNGDLNYISNPGAEVSLVGWQTYNDSASNIPVDGNGGSPTITLTRDTSSPLAGFASFLVSKSAANRQGDGISSAFTLNSADQAKVLKISFDYLASTNFVASDGVTPPLNDGTTSINTGNSDLEVFVYDITNAVLIPVSPQVLMSKNVNGTFQGTFQSASNSTSYRLILHISGTTSSAWTVKLDNVVVSPQPVVFGAAITDAVPYTPSLTQGLGSISSVDLFWRRVGDSLELSGSFVTGTVTGSTIELGLPSGLTIDAAKLPSISVIGIAARGAVGNALLNTLGTGGDSFIQVGVQTVGSAGLTPLPGTSAFGNAETVGITALIPIVGWSSSVQMSSDADTRVVSIILALTGSFSATAGNPIIYDTVLDDSHGVYNSLTGDITAPVSGRYRVSPTSYSAATGYNLNVYIDGVINRRIYLANAGDVRSGSQSFKVNAGSKITIVPDGNATFAGTAGGNDFLNSVSIERISGASAIAALDTISCTVALAVGVSNAPNTNLLYDTIVSDSHAMFDLASGSYTVPTSGRYQISVVSENTGGTNPIMTKTNVQTAYLTTSDSGTIRSGSLIWPFVAGDKISIQQADATRTYNGGVPYQNVLSIVRVGN